MMNVLRFIVAIVLTVLAIIPFYIFDFGIAFLFDGDDKDLAELASEAVPISTRALYLAGPAIFVACFRFQHSKWKRCLAALKTIAVILITYELWRVIAGFKVWGILEDMPGLYIGLDVFINAALVFASGILTSRFIPVLDQPSLEPRPLTVSLFEYLFIFLIAVGLLSSVLGYDQMLANFEEKIKFDPAAAVLTAPAYIFMITFTWVAAVATAVVLITRFGSVMVRNTYIFLMAFSFASIVILILSGKGWQLKDMVPDDTFSYTVFICGIITNIVGIVLILSPSARKWINRGSEDMTTPRA